MPNKPEFAGATQVSFSHGGLRNIRIEVIEHHHQRYQTCGDWYVTPEAELVIRVSKLGDWRKEICIAFHELAEAALCAVDGVSQKLVDDFDIVGIGRDMEEPGNSPESPYHKQHMQAETMEFLLTSWLGLSWEEYEESIRKLSCPGGENATSGKSY